MEQPYKKEGKAKKFYRCQDGCGWKDSTAPGRTRKEPCPKCGKPMAERKGPKAKFWACTGYPECKETTWIEKKGGRGKKR